MLGVVGYVCNRCVWQQITGAEYWPQNSASMQGEKEVTDWTHTLRMLHEIGTARNVELEISESKKIVKAVLEKLASGTTVESYQQCMAGLRDISKT